MSGLDLEGVLAGHRLVGNHCWCDRKKRLTHHEWDAHVAAVIREQIEAAQAEAWDWGYHVGHDHGSGGARLVDADGNAVDYNPYRVPNLSTTEGD